MQPRPWVGSSTALFKFSVAWVTAKIYPSSDITVMQGSTAFMMAQARFTEALLQKLCSKMAQLTSIHSTNLLQQLAEALRGLLHLRQYAIYSVISSFIPHWHRDVERCQNLSAVVPQGNGNAPICQVKLLF